MTQVLIRRNTGTKDHIMLGKTCYVLGLYKQTIIFIIHASISLHFLKEPQADILLDMKKAISLNPHIKGSFMLVFTAFQSLARLSLLLP